MRFIDWIYINIYGQTQRLDNMNRAIIDGNLWASSILGISLGGLYSFLITFFYKLIFKISPPEIVCNKYVSIFIAIGTALIIKWFYEKGDRYFKIYKEYKESNKLISRNRAFLLIMLIGLLPYILWIFVS